MFKILWKQLLCIYNKFNTIIKFIITPINIIYKNNIDKQCIIKFIAFLIWCIYLQYNIIIWSLYYIVYFWLYQKYNVIVDISILEYTLLFIMIIYGLTLLLPLFLNSLSSNIFSFISLFNENKRV